MPFLPGPGCWRRRRMRRRLPGILWPCRPTRRRSPGSASIRKTCLNFGIGWADVIPCGRLSVMSIALYVGMDDFEELLAAPTWPTNISACAFREKHPGHHGATGYLVQQFLRSRDSRHPTLFANTLKYFADYFQQGDMESNGKSVISPGIRSIIIPDRSSGASPAPMANTHSSS